MQPMHNSSFRIKLILILIVFPLALAAFSGWQLSRSSSGNASLAKIDASITHIQELQKMGRGSNVMLTTSDGKKISARTALNRLRTARNNIARQAWWQSSIGTPLAASAILLSLIAALTGACGLFTVRNAGKRALESRDALLAEFQKGLKKLPWTIAAIGCCIALGLACAVSFELVNFCVGGFTGGGVGKVIVIGVFAILALLVFGGKLIWNTYTASKSVFERAPLWLMGKSVSREEAPLVWDFVTSVAARSGATMPDSIILGLDRGFFVTEHPVELASGVPVPPGRVLYLPLPYMAYMTKAETEAVVGHELGHFTGADTEYSLRFSPIYSAAVSNLHAVAMSSDDEGFLDLVAKPAMMFGEYYLDSFDLAVMHWSREREFAADAVGASIAGGEAVALSLLRVSALAPHVCQALDECWNKSGNLEGGVLHRVRELVREHGFFDPQMCLEETQSHPTDTHPVTRQRIEAVGVPITPELLEKAGSPQESDLLSELGIETTDAETAAAWKTLGAAPLHAGKGISSALEAEFSQAAQSNEECSLENLRAIAALGKERIEFFESTLFLSVLATIAIVIFAFIGFAALLHNDALIGVIFALSSIATSYAFVILHKRRKKPFAVFTEHGIAAVGMDAPVPWAALENYEVRINAINGFHSAVETVITLAQWYDPPASSRDRRFRFKPKHHELRLVVLAIAKPHTAEDFSYTLQLYINAAAARAALADLQHNNALQEA